MKMMANCSPKIEQNLCQEADLPSPDAVDDSELLLNAWLDELNTLTAVSFVNFSVMR